MDNFEVFAVEIAKTYKDCYLAIMPGDEGYEIDVEVIPYDYIFTSWGTNTFDLSEARREADRLQKVLEAHSVHVFVNRDEWEDSINEED